MVLATKSMKRPSPHYGARRNLKPSVGVNLSRQRPVLPMDRTVFPRTLKQARKAKAQHRRNQAQNGQVNPLILKSRLVRSAITRVTSGNAFEAISPCQRLVNGARKASS